MIHNCALIRINKVVTSYSTPLGRVEGTIYSCGCHHKAVMCCGRDSHALTHYARGTIELTVVEEAPLSCG